MGQERSREGITHDMKRKTKMKEEELQEKNGEEHQYRRKREGRQKHQGFIKPQGIILSYIYLKLYT